MVTRYTELEVNPDAPSKLNTLVAAVLADGTIPEASIARSTAFALLPNGQTVMNFALTGRQCVKVTPTANATYTTTVPAAGTRSTILILTAGASSFTITFGSGFKPVSTLATGTTASRVFAINFISDGTNLYETGRTAAMVA